MPIDKLTALDRLPRGIGTLLLLLALALLAAIELDAASLARGLPEFQGMGRNTLLAFALSGAALLVATRQSWGHWPGIGVALMAMAVLAQYQLNDFPLDSRWQYLLNTLSDQPWPGRMSPPTALSFLAAGIALAWWPRVRGGMRLALVQGLLLILLLPALISLTGYTMGMAVLTTQAPRLALLSLPTAVGLALLYLALQIQVARGVAARDYFAGYPDRYMLTVAAMLLLVSPRTRNLSGFSVKMTCSLAAIILPICSPKVGPRTPRKWSGCRTPSCSKKISFRLAS